jgi:hypothetical protein
VNDPTKAETFIVHNANGSFSLDPWAGKNRDELKQRCGELCRSLDEWQRLAMTLFNQGKDALSLEEQDKIRRLVAGYSYDGDDCGPIPRNDHEGSQS